MSGEPLWRGKTIDLMDYEEGISDLPDYLPVPSGTEVEVWRAGDRPVPPTRQQIRQAIEPKLASNSEYPRWVHIEDATEAVWELLSGQEGDDDRG